MQLRPEVHESEIPGLVGEFIAITGLPVWLHRRKWAGLQLKANGFLRDYFEQIYAVEMEFFRVLVERENNGGVFQSRPITQRRYRLFAFISTVVSIYQQLSVDGKKRLKGMLVGGLSTDGLTPLEQELGVAIHLFGRGFDVSFTDMEKTARFDYLAAKEGIEAEVECKRVGLDLGRKVPRLAVLNLQKLIHDQVQSLAPRLTSGALLRVTLPARLTVNVPLQQAITAAVVKVCLTGVPLATNDCEVTLSEFAIQESMFDPASRQPDTRIVRQYLKDQFFIVNTNMMVLGVHGRGMLAVSIESRQSDTVLDNLFDELSDSAAKQLSKTRPGVLCVQFIDLTDAQVRRLGSSSNNPVLASPSRILRDASRFLDSERRSHVHSIVFRGVGGVAQESDVQGDVLTQQTQEVGAALIVTNDNHPLARDRRYATFGAAVAPQRIVIAR